MTAQPPRPSPAGKPGQVTATRAHRRPGPVPRRRLPPGDRRHELIEAAVRVLRRLGPHDCRVEDITAEAGTAKGNFYRYFPTWDDLLLALRAHLLDSYGEQVRQRYASPPEDGWDAALDDEIDRFLTFQLGLGGLHDAVFHGPAGRARPAGDGQSAAALIAWFLTAGIAAGAFASIDPDATGRLLFHLLHGAADEIAAGGDRQRIQQAVLVIIHRALDPQSPAGAAQAAPDDRR